MPIQKRGLLTCDGINVWVPYTCKCTYILCTEAMSTPYRIAFRANRKSYSVNGNWGHRTGTSRSHTSNIVPERLAGRVWWTKSQSSLNIYFRLGGFHFSFVPIHFLYSPSTCSHCDEAWQKVAIQYLTLHFRDRRGTALPVTRIAPKSPLLCLNRSPKSGMVFLLA